MRQLWLVVAVAGSGCNSLLGIDELTLAPIDAEGTMEIDAPEIDAPIVDSPPNSLCAMLVAPGRCSTPPPTGMITIENVVDTDADGRCQAFTPTAGPPICVIVGDTITIPIGGARIKGAKPLLLLAATTIIVDGVLDAGSTSLGATPRIGPAANATPTSCANPPNGSASTDGGGGGGGGTFSTKGGDAGDGAGNGGGNGGNAANAQTTTILRAGCRGGAGGNAGAGAGGSGGGAIYLSAGTSILINNRVLANGAAGIGAAGAGQAGGGGGGSGGMIMLEAPTITLMGTTAEISANGAGGGEGTLNTDAGEGIESTAWNVAATGGTNGSTEGGNGGSGSVATGNGVNGANGVSSSGNVDGGGGGGGGGAGLVWYRGTLGGAQVGQVSPPAVPK